MQHDMLNNLLSSRITDTTITHSHTLAGVAVFLIFPQDTASSGLAPESLPSNSDAVLMNTLKSAPFLYNGKIHTTYHLLLLENKKNILRKYAVWMKMNFENRTKQSEKIPKG